MRRLKRLADLEVAIDGAVSEGIEVGWLESGEYLCCDVHLLADGPEGQLRARMVQRMTTDPKDNGAIYGRDGELLARVVEIVGNPWLMGMPRDRGGTVRERLGRGARVTTRRRGPDDAD